MKILLAEDNVTACAILSHVIKQLGYEVVTAHDGEQALEIYRTQSVDVVLTDVQMPVMGGFELLQAIREDDSDTLIIIITALGSSDTAIKALQFGANNFIRKPVSPQELTRILQKYTSVVEQRQISHELDGMITRRAFTMEIDNRRDYSTRVAQFLVSQVPHELKGKGPLHVVLGLDELIANAIEHGNMGISSEEKEKALIRSDGLIRLYEKRLTDPVVSQRRVRIDFTMEKGRYCEWVITDEGEGFDYSKLPDPLEAGAITKQTGRGIFLSRMIFDVFEYRDRGNQICVRINL